MPHTKGAYYATHKETHVSHMQENTFKPKSMITDLFYIKYFNRGQGWGLWY